MTCIDNFFNCSDVEYHCICYLSHLYSKNLYIDEEAVDKIPRAERKNALMEEFERFLEECYLEPAEGDKTSNDARRM